MSGDTSPLGRPAYGALLEGQAQDVPIFNPQTKEFYTGQAPPAIKRGPNIGSDDVTLSVLNGCRYVVPKGGLEKDIIITLSSDGAIDATRPYTIWVECYDDSPFTLSFVDEVSGSTLDTVDASEGEFAYGFAFSANWAQVSFLYLEPLP